MAQKGGAYENPSLLYGPDNVAVIANTMSQYRNRMAQNTQVLQQAMKARSQKVRDYRDFKSKGMTGYNKAYSAAKGELSKFQSKIKDKEGLTMSMQINNALKVVGQQLNTTLDEIGPNGSQADISFATQDAISQIDNLKSQLTAFYEAHQEWQAAQQLPPGEKNAILANSNPQLQLIFQKMENGEEDIILQQDPTSKNWLFIPLETEGEKKKDIDGLKEREKSLKDKISATSNVDQKTILENQLKEVEVELKTQNARVLEKYEDYYDDSGKRNDDLYSTKGTQDKYTYDPTIGIVDLANVQKSVGQNGSYFQHVEEVEEEDFIQRHNELLEANPSLFGSFAYNDKGELNLETKAPTGKSQGGTAYSSAQIADYYLNKGGQDLLDSYINEDNLNGQLESLIGGDAGEYYASTGLRGGAQVWDAGTKAYVDGRGFDDIDALTPEQKKDEIRWFMLNKILATNPKLYDKGDKTKLGKEANEDFSSANRTDNTQFKFQ